MSRNDDGLRRFPFGFPNAERVATAYFYITIRSGIATASIVGFSARAVLERNPGRHAAAQMSANCFAENNGRRRVVLQRCTPSLAIISVAFKGIEKKKIKRFVFDGFSSVLTRQGRIRIASAELFGNH